MYMWKAATLGKSCVIQCCIIIVPLKLTMESTADANIAPDGDSDCEDFKPDPRIQVWFTL